MSIADYSDKDIAIIYGHVGDFEFIRSVPSIMCDKDPSCTTGMDVTIAGLFHSNSWISQDSVPNV